MADHFPVYCLKHQNTKKRWDQKVQAANYAFDEMCKEIHKKAEQKTTEQVVDDRDIDSDFDEFDIMNEDDPYADIVKVDESTGSIQKSNYKITTLEAWKNALPYNLTFLVGFDVLGLDPRDEITCFCPCGPKMKKWRKQFFLGDDIEGIDQCTRHKRMEPQGLMDHLNKTDEGGGFIHGLIELYIRKLYEKTEFGTGHKALYKKEDANYKLAVAAEKKYNIRCREQLEKENAEKDRKLKEAEERIQKYKEETEKFKKVRIIIIISCKCHVTLLATFN